MKIRTLLGVFWFIAVLVGLLLCGGGTARRNLVSIGAASVGMVPSGGEFMKTIQTVSTYQGQADPLVDDRDPRCINLKAKLDSLTRREVDLKTALLPARLHLARLQALTGLNGSKACKLESELAQVRSRKEAVLIMIKSMGCRDLPEKHRYVLDLLA